MDLRFLTYTFFKPKQKHGKTIDLKAKNAYFSLTRFENVKEPQEHMRNRCFR